MDNIELLSKVVGNSSSDGTLFFLGIFFSLIGMIYFNIGRKQFKKPFLYSGILLMVFPYVISGKVLTILIGIILTLIPIIYKKIY